MITRRRSVVWCPHNPSRFAVAASDIRLYEISTEKKSLPDQGIVDPSCLPDDYLPGQTDVAQPPSSTSYRLVDTITDDPHAFKHCISWCPDPGHADLIATGSASGRATLFQFSSDTNFVGQFLPRFARPCNALAFSLDPTTPLHLAVGLSRVRGGDPCVLLWDTARAMQLSADPIDSGGFNLLTGRSSVCAPLVQLSATEGVLSLAWDPSQPGALAVGTDNKWLRVYDIRGPSSGAPLSVMAHSRGVRAVAFDPLAPHRLATSSDDGVVCVWDTRLLTAPAYTITTCPEGSIIQPLIQLAWCPTRAGLLATSSREEAAVQVWDIASLLAGKNAAEPLPAQPPRSRTLSLPLPADCFAWQPGQQLRLMAVNNDGALQPLVIQEAVPIAFGPEDRLFFIDQSCDDQSVPKGTMSVPHPRTLHCGQPGDISSLMRSRAEAGYSLLASQNIQLLSAQGADAQLLKAWAWVQSCQSQTADPITGQTDRIRFPGMRDYLLMSLTGSQPEAGRDFFNVGQINPNCGGIGVFPVFETAERAAVLRLCGWRPLGCRPEDLMHDLQELEASGQPERAAAIAVFSLSLEAAVSILERAVQRAEEVEQLAAQKRKHKQARQESEAEAEKEAKEEKRSPSGSAEKKKSSDGEQNTGKEKEEVKPNEYTGQERQQSPEDTLQQSSAMACLSLVAVALASQASVQPHSPLWRSACERLLPRLTNPYLHALFAFLSASPPNYSSILDAKEIAVTDKIAFALRFLPHTQLLKYLEAEERAAIKAGNLDSLFLVGLGARGVDLLQSYLDRKADVQTVALLACFAGHDGLNDMRLSKWIESYRSLLNSWRLWFVRAAFDVSRNTIYPPPSQDQLSSLARPGQCFARCYYCQQSLAGWKLARTADRSLPGASRVLRLAVPGGAQASMRARVACCPTCRKSLPRCSLCLLPFNCVSPSPDWRNATGGSALPFSQWMVWCQSCRHGGHAEHLQEWFQTQEVCPVADCNCRCMSLDKLC